MWKGEGSVKEACLKVLHAQVLERGSEPVFGICMGNQLTALAAGAKSYKLPLGNRLVLFCCLSFISVWMLMKGVLTFCCIYMLIFLCYFSLGKRSFRFHDPAHFRIMRYLCICFFFIGCDCLYVFLYVATFLCLGYLFIYLVLHFSLLFYSPVLLYLVGKSGCKDFFFISWFFNCIFYVWVGVQHVSKYITCHTQIQYETVKSTE